VLQHAVAGLRRTVSNTHALTRAGKALAQHTVRRVPCEAHMWATYLCGSRANGLALSCSTSFAPRDRTDLSRNAG